MSFRTLPFLLCAGLASIGCAGPRPPSSGPQPELPASAGEMARVAPSADPGAEEPGAAEPPAPLPSVPDRASEAVAPEDGPPPLARLPGAPSASAPPASHPLEDGRRPEPKKALPSLTMRHVGMHVGGGKNTSEEKKPLLAAIEKRSNSILQCYRFVSSPGTSGTFGVDLRIPATGGSPEVKKTRHKLGDFEFESCMHRAFETVRFPALPRPTVVSYSLRFEF